MLEVIQIIDAIRELCKLNILNRKENIKNLVTQNHHLVEKKLMIYLLQKIRQCLFLGSSTKSSFQEIAAIDWKYTYVQ